MNADSVINGDSARSDDPPTSDQNRVYIVDDDDASREAVESLVGEMNVHYEAYRSAEDFLNAYDGQRPGCLVTDIRMLRMSGLELQEELQRRGCTLSVVVLTAYAETPVVVRAMKNGAVTLLEKPCRDYELWDAIRAALLSDSENHQREQRRLLLQSRIDKLTSTEQQVLDLIVAGLPNKAIASQLDISTRTVEVRRQQVFKKLNADSLAELVQLVVEARDDE